MFGKPLSRELVQELWLCVSYGYSTPETNRKLFLTVQYRHVFFLSPDRLVLFKGLKSTYPAQGVLCQ